jgi:hypothetical protein
MWLVNMQVSSLYVEDLQIEGNNPKRQRLELRRSIEGIFYVVVDSEAKVEQWC